MDARTRRISCLLIVCGAAGCLPRSDGGDVKATASKIERASLGEPFLDIDPEDCYRALDCQGRDCPPLPAYCTDPGDPEFRFQPGFRDRGNRTRDERLSPDYKTTLRTPGAPSQETLDFWPGGRTTDMRLRVAEAPVPGKTLLERDGRVYLEFTAGDLLIRVVNEKSPTFGRGDPPAAATLLVRGTPLDKVELVKTLGLGGVGGRELTVEAVAVYLANNAGAPRAEPLAQQPMGSVTQGTNTCEAQAIHQFELASYNGQFVQDMPPVRFPPITDSGYSDCTKQQCVDMYLGWLRAHHNVWRARQMIQLLDAIPNADQRAFAWGRPGRDWNGNKTNLRASPKHWFGTYSADAHNQTKTAINKLWERFNDHKVGDFNIKLRCPTSGGNVCNTTEGVVAHHIVVSQVDFCDLYFNLGGRCYGGEWDDENEVCHGFIVSGDWRRAATVAHEVLHHTSINSVYVQDKHSHGHGQVCLSNLKILEAMYEYDKVRHLATETSCLHEYEGRHNTDSYAWFITTIGDMVYRGQMKTWPAWGDPTPQPPQNCTVGNEGCYCKTVNPAFDAPDGDYRADKFCEDNDGEMTCQETHFNAGAIVGICTKCDDVRGAGCECDAERPCDKGDCWGELTANGHHGVGHCYEYPPPSWACLADCKQLYNSPAGRCYWDHPSGKARCIDGVICEEIEESACFQQGKVCRDGACVAECAGTQDCRYDFQPGEDDLDYPSYYECGNNMTCEAVPAHASF